jgi:hypothetical protein
LAGRSVIVGCWCRPSLLRRSMWPGSAVAAPKRGRAGGGVAPLPSRPRVCDEQRAAVGTPLSQPAPRASTAGGGVRQPRAAFAPLSGCLAPRDPHTARGAFPRLPRPRRCDDARGLPLAASWVDHPCGCWAAALGTVRPSGR